METSGYHSFDIQMDHNQGPLLDPVVVLPITLGTALNHNHNAEDALVESGGISMSPRKRNRSFTEAVDSSEFAERYPRVLFELPAEEEDDAATVADASDPPPKSQKRKKRTPILRDFNPRGCNCNIL